MTKEEHLAWAQRRALAYCDLGDTTQAFASLVSDFQKHPDLREHIGLPLGVQLLIIGDLAHPAAMRRFILGFH